MVELSIDQADNIENLLNRLVNDTGFFLDDESLSAVKDYIAHREYEMAFEGFFMELIEKQIQPVGFEIYHDLGKELGLDRESVFDALFWQKFSFWLGNSCA
ncbi:hypothetical protein [Cellvibrio sp. UBA7671]|uniref:hypothetical protein n=1 Tax=Cellvibrio sp. UBA7671 TaxID=1946312 RepID=UPI002F35643B